MPKLALKRSYDVIVLGTGIAGLATALAAAEQGLQVLVIEKADKVGGGTTDSYGLIWVGNNHLAKAEGYTDRREDILAYMTFVAGGEESQEHLAAYVDRSPQALKFFEKCGIRFRVIRGLKDHYLGVAPGATAEGRSLEVELISGFDLGKWRTKVRTPVSQPYFITAEEQINWGGVNRMSHWDQDLVRERKARDMRGKGVGLISHFVAALHDRDVAIVTSRKVDRLLTSGGRVVGVRIGKSEDIKARLGVALATGGYESNPELVGTYECLPGWRSQCPPSNTGDGLMFGSEIGAASHLIRTNLQMMFGIEIPSDAVKEGSYVHAAGIVEMCSPHTLVVNRQGRRFADEAYFQGMVSAVRQFDALSHSHVNLPAFLIFDSEYASKYSFADRAAGAPIPGWVARDATPGGLARKLKIDPAGLESTVERFNDFASAGRDEDFHRGELAWRLANEQGAAGRNQSLGPLTKPPFYGIELHPTGGASAGLLTNAKGQVLHQRRHPIPGLYAIGNTAAKVEFGSGYQAGFTLASGMTFGYIAVENMVREAAKVRRSVKQTAGRPRKLERV